MPSGSSAGSRGHVAAKVKTNKGYGCAGSRGHVAAGAKDAFSFVVRL